MKMQNLNPLVSIIMLSYNKASFILESLESICLQTYKNIQVIIVDDGSTDQCPQIIKKWVASQAFPCDFIAHKENKGICKRMNEALSYVKGKYVAHLGSDDLWIPEKLALQVEHMEKLPEEVGVLYSDSWVIDEEGIIAPQTILEEESRSPPPSSENMLESLISGNFLPAITVLMRKECYEKVGNYDENLCYEDWDLWLRIAQHYRFVFSPLISAKYRKTKSSFGLYLSQKRKKKLIWNNIKILKKSLNSSFNSHAMKRHIIKHLFLQRMRFIRCFFPEHMAKKITLFLKGKIRG